MTYVVQNTAGLSSGLFGAILRFAARGTSAGSLRVAVTGNNLGTTNSDLIDYTTTLTYYTLIFTAGAFDTNFTITLGGSSPGSADAQPSAVVYFTDWSMSVGTVENYLEGGLTLLNGSFQANNITCTTQISTDLLDVQTQLLVPAHSHSTFEGPTFCSGTIYASGGLTGSIGTFNTLNAGTIASDGTGSFQNLSTTNLTATGLTTLGVP
ncbi:MAG: hypothetical protein EBZ36_15405, partial [Acidobacteria bacterium]|nr:hypothetical protein [Acidobacteriota bacterium]